MKKLIVFVCILFLCFSCSIRSLHSILEEEDRILDERIEGVWSGVKPLLIVSDIDVSIESDDVNENVDSIKSEMLKYLSSNNVSIDPDNDTDDINASKSELEEMIDSKNETLKESWTISRSAKLDFEGSSSKSLYFTSSISLEGVSEHYDINKGLEIEGMTYKLKDKSLLDFYIMEFNGDNDFENHRSKLVQLTKIGSNYFMDISEIPNDAYGVRSYDFLYSNIYGHTVVKLEFEGDQIKLFEFDSDYLEKLIDEKRIRLKHETVGDGIILTASTSQLRAFLNKYGNDDRLFLDEAVFYAQNL